jgi:hypothetical protein
MGIIITIILAIASGFAVSGLLSVSKSISSTGSVKGINVEVYWDSACTIIADTIDWGTPEPGESVVRMVYVKNTGNAPMNISMTTSSWTPSGADTYLTLSWDREGVNLAADEVVQATLTLSVSNSITGITDFSFNVTVEGTG